MIEYIFDSCDKMILYGIGIENMYKRHNVSYRADYTIGAYYILYIQVQ